MTHFDISRGISTPMPMLALDPNPDDAADAILEAMRGLRENLRDLGGQSLVALADEALADRLRIRLLQLGNDDAAPTDSAFADSVMLDAADMCARSATSNAATRSIFYVLLLMLDRLVAAYGEPITSAELTRSLDLRPDRIALITGLGSTPRSRTR